MKWKVNMNKHENTNIDIAIHMVAVTVVSLNFAKVDLDCIRSVYACVCVCVCLWLTVMHSMDFIVSTQTYFESSTWFRMVFFLLLFLNSRIYIYFMNPISKATKIRAMEKNHAKVFTQTKVIHCV